MAAPGQPTTYKPEYCELANKDCLLCTTAGAMSAREQEPALWVRQENDRRKGRKGRKLPATIRRFGFVNGINHLSVHGAAGLRRSARRKLAETGGNSIPGLAYRLRKLRKSLKSGPASPRLLKKPYAATPSTLRIDV
jgi:hypothetical protein